MASTVAGELLELVASTVVASTVAGELLELVASTVAGELLDLVASTVELELVASTVELELVASTVALKAALRTTTRSPPTDSSGRASRRILQPGEDRQEARYRCGTQNLEKDPERVPIQPLDSDFFKAFGERSG